MVDVAPPGLGLTKRKAKRNAADDAEAALGRFVRLEHWNGMSVGDVVRVSGHSARGRHWRFRAHVTNTSNGASWIEVSLVEGSPPSRRPAAPRVVEGTGDESPEPVLRVERVRSFAEELVTPRWKRRGWRTDRGTGKGRLSSGGSESDPEGESVETPSAQQSMF